MESFASSIASLAKGTVRALSSSSSSPSASSSTPSPRFRETFTHDKRLEVSSKIQQKFPDRVPVIVERSLTERTLPDIMQRKFLIPSDATAGKLQHEVRKQIAIAPHQAIFIFMENCGGDGGNNTTTTTAQFTMPNASTTLSELYTRYHHADGFLYVTYTGESTFGGE